MRLVGTQSNRYGVGVRICVKISTGGAVRSIYRHVNSGGSFGDNPLRQTIGLEKAYAIQSVEVFWPKTGKTQTVDEVALNQFIRIVEGEDGYTRLKLKEYQLGENRKFDV